jgi:hypothetical protein
MKNKLTLRLGAAALSIALMTPAVILAQDHDDHHDRDDHHNRDYRDNHHHDNHHWNDHEDRAYHMWLEQRHHKYVEFDRLNAREQQRYWDWRHNHDDSVLKIVIR